MIAVGIEALTLPSAVHPGAGWLILGVDRSRESGRQAKGQEQWMDGAARAADFSGHGGLPRLVFR